MDRQGTRIAELARRSENFGYLLDDKPLLVAFGAGAEASVYDDPNGAMVKARQFAEVMASDLVARLGLAVPTSHDPPTQAERVRALVREGVLVPGVERVFTDLRKLGNRANHEYYADVQAALRAVRGCFELGQWFHLALTGGRERRGFVPPVPSERLESAAAAGLRADLDRYRVELAEARLRLEGSTSRLVAEEAARREAEVLVAEALRERDGALALAAELDGQLDALAGTPNQVRAVEREAFVERARRPAPLNEAEVRRVIDRMLIDAGWLVQDYSTLNPTAGPGVAVREFPLAGGRADYVLYAGGAIVGVVEAKREGTPLSGVEKQTVGYATALPRSHNLALWPAAQPVPFRYESTGAETYFTNALDPQPRARPMFSFHRPETVLRWMREADADPDAPTLRARLRPLPAIDDDRLRPAQVDAVRGVEASLAAGRPGSLVQMATGAGTTFAAVTLCYRLLRHARRSERVETDRFRAFDYDGLLGRDKVNLDITWLTDPTTDSADDLLAPELIAQEIVDDLQSALAEFTALADSLADSRAVRPDPPA